MLDALQAVGQALAVALGILFIIIQAGPLYFKCLLELAFMSVHKVLAEFMDCKRCSNNYCWMQGGAYMGFVEVKWNNVHKEVIRRFDVNRSGWVALLTLSSCCLSCGGVLIAGGDSLLGHQQQLRTPLITSFVCHSLLFCVQDVRRQRLQVNLGFGPRGPLSGTDSACLCSWEERGEPHVPTMLVWNMECLMEARVLEVY